MDGYGKISCPRDIIFATLLPPHPENKRYESIGGYLQAYLTFSAASTLRTTAQSSR